MNLWGVDASISLLVGVFERQFAFQITLKFLPVKFHWRLVKGGHHRQAMSVRPCRISLDYLRKIDTRYGLVQKIGEKVIFWLFIKPQKFNFVEKSEEIFLQIFISFDFWSLDLFEHVFEEM